MELTLCENDILASRIHSVNMVTEARSSRPSRIVRIVLAIIGLGMVVYAACDHPLYGSEKLLRKITRVAPLGIRRLYQLRNLPSSLAGSSLLQSWHEGHGFELHFLRVRFDVSAFRCCSCTQLLLFRKAIPGAKVQISQLSCR